MLGDPARREASREPGLAHPPGPRWLHAGSRTRWDDDATGSPLIREAWEQAGYPLSELNQDTTLITFGAVTALINFTGAHYPLECARVGRARLCDPWSVRLCDPWAAHGQVHNKLGLTRVLPEPVPCRGMPGLWPVPDIVLAKATAQLSR